MNKFILNQQIFASEHSTIIKGTAGRITDVFQDGAFWKYQIEWCGDKDFVTITRETDLIAA